MKQTIIFGTGGFSEEILMTINAINNIKKSYKILGFIDDDDKKHGKKIGGVKVLGGIDWFMKNKISKLCCIISVGDPIIRKKIVERLSKFQLEFPTLIHPSVIHDKFRKIGKGVIIQAGTIITTNVTINDHVHINIDCTVGHQTKINNFCTLAPGIHLSGDCVLEEGVYLGAGVVTLDKIKIKRWSIVGAGSTIINNISENAIYLGNPAKLRRRISSPTDRPKI